MMLECLTFMSQTTLSVVNLFYNFFTGLSSIVFAGKVTLLFLLIVLIRITVPRLRLETLSRSSWLLGLTVVGFWVTLYFLVFLFI